MESKTGSLLALIAGVISGISTVILIMVVFSYWGFLSGGLFGSFGNDPGAILQIIAIIMIVLAVVISFLFILSSRWMKNSEKVRKGAIMTLILGIVILPFGLINGVLGIISGVIGLRDSKK